MTHPLRVGVIGAGRVGAVLAAALRSAGHDIVAVAGESDASRNRIADLLPGVPVDKPTAVARRCDLLLLTVPDDMLSNVVAMLSASGAIRPGQYVVHTSGRHGLAVLAEAVEVGARPVALHPAMTFTGTAVDLPRLGGLRLRRHRRRGRARPRRAAGRRPRRPHHVGVGGAARALPRRARARRQPPGHPGRPGPGDARRGRCRQPRVRPRRHAAAAAHRRPRQRPPRGRHRPDRPDGARRRQHRAGPPRADRRQRAAHAAVVRRAGRRHPRPGGDRRPGAADPGGQDPPPPRGRARGCRAPARRPRSAGR